jgi:methylenetetrahydrofolate dehydrogenase (NADP+)/methenyltetrahydrofolate cyclohydrolase
VHGILVQLPLPKGLDTQAVINAIDPAKDVDGLHPINAGRLATGLTALTPCTPLGCISLAKTVHASLEGLNAVIIGRPNLVGRPLVQLLLNENATVNIAHSRTRDLANICKQADLLLAAVGKPEMVKANWIKPGATVIDVGINRVSGADGKSRLIGDVAYQEASQVAGAITD